MKATIEFDLLEEREDFERMSKANQLCCVIWDFQQYLRKLYRRDDERLSKMSADHLIEEMYGEDGKWWACLDEHGINLDRIWS